MKYLLILLALCGTGCTMVISKEDIRICDNLCEGHGGAKKYGKQWYTKDVCCECLDSTVYDEAVTYD